MAEPVRMYKGKDTWDATSPTQVKQFEADGWSQKPEPQPALLKDAKEEEPKKRGRPAKANTK